MSVLYTDTLNLFIYYRLASRPGLARKSIKFSYSLYFKMHLLHISTFLWNHYLFLPLNLMSSLKDLANRQLKRIQFNYAIKR